MDNTRNNNIRRANASAMKNGHVVSKLLPIYIVKRDLNGNELGRKKVNFQINYGHVYHINYKYFIPKGYRLAKNSTSKVTCKYDKSGLNPNSITFTYVKKAAHNNKPKPQSKPIWISFVNINNNEKVQAGSVNGKYGQKVNILDQIAIPNGYVLCNNQQTTFKISDSDQSIYLLVKPIAHKAHPVHHNKPKPQSTSHTHNNRSANNQSQTDQVKVHPNDALHSNIKADIQSLESNLQKYDCNLAVQLIHEVLSHNLESFKKVIAQIFTKMKYKDVNNLKTDPQENKIIGVVKKYLYNNNHVNFTFVRARKYDIRHQVTISEVRDFVTSVMDHNSSKGVFITTSRFSSDARKEAERHSIILIDDMKLAKLMIQYDVGVKPKRIFRIVNIDRSFF